MKNDSESVPGESVPENQPAWKKNLRPAWKPGLSGNMAGRSVGCRNRLSEKFLSDLLAVYDKHGKAAIEDIAVNQPVEFLRIIAKLLPRKAEIEVTAAHEINISLAQRRRIAESWLASSSKLE